MEVLIDFVFNVAELPGVRWVLPDSYLDVKNKDYGGNLVPVLCHIHMAFGSC